MDRRPVQTCFQRHTAGQQAHEKMLNTADHQRNAHQKHNEISPHTCQNGYHGKVCRQQMLERKWEWKLVQPPWKTAWTFLKNLKPELPYDPAIPFLDIYLKKAKTLV